MKKCPFCAEEIQDEAVKCRHCNEFLNAKKKTAFYHNAGFLIIMFFGVGPFMLPLVWTNPGYSKKTKIVITVIVLVVSWLLIKATVNAWHSLNQYYGMFSGKVPAY